MRIQILTDGPALRPAVLVAAVLAVCFSAVSAPALADRQTKQFCKEFLNFGDDERASWYAEIDSAIYESFEESKDLINWSESQLASYAECQRESQTAFGLEIEEACKVGMRNMSVFGKISGQRTTACIDQVSTGEVDPESEPDAALQAEQFCEEFLNWGESERASWYADIDSTAYESLEESTDLNWSASQLALAKGCLQETQMAFGLKIAESCAAGMRDLSVIGEIAGPRMKACIKKVVTGELDPEWGSGAVLQAKQFCPDWSKWGADERAEFLRKGDVSARRAIEQYEASPEQRTEFDECLAASRADVTERLNRACSEAISYLDAVNVVGTQAAICARRIGIEME